jgi:hypothetical protein
LTFSSFPIVISTILLLLRTTSQVVDGISLLGGRYETVTDVQAYLDLALDAAAMKESDDLTLKMSIYQQVRK